MKGTSEIMLYNQLKRTTEQVKTSLINGISSLVFGIEETVDYELAF